MSNGIASHTLLSQLLTEQDALSLESLGLTTVSDLLTNWPRRHRERGPLKDLSEVANGEVALVEGFVTSLKEERSKKTRRPFLKMTVVNTHMQEVRATIFNPAEMRRQGLAENVTVTMSGKLGTFGGKRTIDIAELEIGAASEVGALSDPIASIYRATASVASPWIAEQIADLLRRLPPLPEHLPAGLVAQFKLPSYDWAVRAMHRPKSLEDVREARRRLAFDEAFAVQLALAVARLGVDAPAREVMVASGDALDRFDAALPFTLTQGQQVAGEAILAGLGGSQPLNALLVGEVGSGKTLVAQRALLRAVDCGTQGVFVAPTEVLARQHHMGLKEAFEPLGVVVELLTGSLKAAERKRVLEQAASGRGHIFVGTHSLLSPELEFANLGLVVVDEQHRFGVEARDALRANPAHPHMLVMTATPIPRSLAMTVHGDLDVIRVEGLPAGRTPITTVVTPEFLPQWMDRLWAKVAEEIAAGRQAFIVTPVIDTDEDSALAGKSISDLQDLASGKLPGARIETLHGKLAPEEKDAAMERFATGSADLLIATSVIEVGVNVPNATVMAIWGSDRFGVAQLHQLRGRVGRGIHPGLCLLVTDQPEGHDAYKRLRAVASTLDGMALAEMDMAARREGDVTSTGQAGGNAFKLLSMVSDGGMIAAARVKARELVAADPSLSKYPRLVAWMKAQLSAEQQRNLVKS